MTRRLILIRHAKSDWSSGVTVDHARPLNMRGQAAADALGQWLRHNGHLPDEALCSTAQRTRDTWQRLGLNAPIRYLDTLYHAPGQIMFETLNKATGDCVLMLGHNPGIAEFAAWMLGTAPAHNRFRDYPTAATLIADFDIDSWADLSPGTGRAVTFVTPHDL